MNKIKDVSFSRLSTPELRSLADGVATTLATLASTDQHVNRSVEVIKGSLSNITNVNNLTSGSEVTDDIQSTDGEMDSAIRLTRDTLLNNVAMAAYDAPKAEASAVLLGLIEKRSRALFIGGYAEQGAEMTDFLDDVFDNSLTDVRQASGVAPILDTVKAKFTKLKELLAQRAAEEAAPTTVKEQKNILKFRLDSLLNYVNINCVDNVDGFADTATPLNDIITTVMSQCKARMTRKENQEDLEN